MALAAGHADTVGVALFTMTLTCPVTTLYWVVFVGVKVTLSDGNPALGAVPGAVHAKAPGTEAVPPVNVDEASVCP